MLPTSTRLTHESLCSKTGRNAASFFLRGGQFDDLRYLLETGRNAAHFARIFSAHFSADVCLPQGEMLPISPGQLFCLF